MLPHLRYIVIAWVLSCLGAALINPDLLIHQHLSYLAAHDPEAPFQSVFALINQFTHGGIALFDRYDQFTFVFAQLTTGIYTTVNVITALVYLALSPWMENQAHGFHHLYTVVFHTLTILLRCAGGYLLLHRFRVPAAVNILSLFVFNTLLTLSLYLGLETNVLYSYLPLLLYFIWSFLDEGRLEHLLGACVMMSIAIANSALFALGYFYEVVHFFIVSGLVWAVATKRWRHWRMREQIKGNAGKIVNTGLLCLLIVAPWVWMAKLLSHDFFISDSGVGGTEGRLKSMFKPMLYFAPDRHHFAPVQGFLKGALDFQHADWEFSWIFVGISTFVLTIIALWKSPHRAKWLFFAAIILVLLTNTPLQPASPLAVAHWVNVLTNPFKFLLRTFLMPTLLMLFLFLPLVAFGMEVVWRMRRGPWRTIALTATIVFIFGDCVMAHIYVKHYQDPDKKIIAPRIRFPLAGPTPIIMEYQNPLIMPFQEHYRILPVPTGPPFLHSSENMFGLFYKYTPMARHLGKPFLYFPLPSAYKDFYADTDAAGHNFTELYLSRDTRLMFTAQGAVRAEDMPRQAWLALGLDRRVALIDGAPPEMPGLIRRPQEIQTQPPVPAPSTATTFSFNLEDATFRARDQFTEYRFPLPKNFPAEAATTLFTEDKDNIKASISGLALSPMQGTINAPLGFDINNIKKGWLTVSLPPEFMTQNQQVQVSVTRSGELGRVWCNQLDRIGITYNAPQDGWLVTHLPYDGKWRMTIDGAPVRIWKTNTYFLGTPIRRGEHKVLIEYWPGSPLRWMIPLSVVLTLAALAGAINLGFQLERHRNA